MAYETARNWVKDTGRTSESLGLRASQSGCKVEGLVPDAFRMQISLVC